MVKKKKGFEVERPKLEDIGKVHGPKPLDKKKALKKKYVGE